MGDHVTLGTEFGEVARCAGCGASLRARERLRLDGAVAAIAGFAAEHATCPSAGGEGTAVAPAIHGAA